MNVKSEIRSVIAKQATSLLEVKKEIGQPFQTAVELIIRCKGKIVVTGVGKSGLVARKIASTFSSTGTPAIYLHPVEGMHGNLGLLQKNDILFAIGKSGESDELLNLIPTVKKIGVKIISLTANSHSSLARRSHVVLFIPIRREACPLNLAPTTSSTIALVLGDAIAITLMKLRGFKQEDFALYHPGGVLGKRLLLHVSDIMRKGRDNPCMHVNASVRDLLIEIAAKWAGAASIYSKNRHLVGLVTDYDIRKAFAQGKQLSNLTIREIMNPKPTIIYSDQMAIDALRRMESRNKPLTVMPVVDRKRRSVGIVHLHDFIVQGLLKNSPKNR